MSHSGASVGIQIGGVSQGGASVGTKWSKCVKEKKRVRVPC